MLLDQKLRSTAHRQGGYFSATQAIKCGFHPNLQRYHALCGDWIKIERALFRLPGYPDTLESDFTRWSFWAIGRSPNRQVVVSHDSALFYYDLTFERPADVHLNVPVKLFKKEEKTGCVFHREEMNPEDVVSHTGYKITSPARTLQDMKSALLLKSIWADTVRLAQENNLIDREIARNLLGDILFQQAGSGQSWARPTTQGGFPAGQSGELCAAGMPDSNQRKTEVRDYGARMGTGHYFGGRMAARSFTLVEMLVVIAIIVILSSLLLPALRKSMNKAHQVVCANNLKEIAAGVHSYASDMSGFLPQADSAEWGGVCSFLGAIYPYFGYEKKYATTWDNLRFYQGKGSPFWCPSAVLYAASEGGLQTPSVTVEPKKFMNASPAHYAYSYVITYTKIGRSGGWFRWNGSLDTAYTYMREVPQRISATLPASVIMHDVMAFESGNRTFSNPGTANDHDNSWNAKYSPNWLHSGFADCLLLDGSVHAYAKYSEFSDDFVRKR